MEDGGRGAVYVCRAGTEPHCVQRLPAVAVSVGLSQFGAALDGSHDLNGDGGPDLAVGAMGQALIFSSRPVVSVSAILSLPVRRLPHLWGRCGAAAIAVGLRLCMRTNLVSTTYTGRLLVPIHFLFRVEPQRRWSRGHFPSGSTTWEDRMLLEGEERCLNNTVLLQPCPEDSLTPLRLAVNYSLDPEYPTDPTGDPIAVIHPTSNSAWIEVPYEQRCGSAGLCDPDVSLKARAPPGGTLLLGGPEVTAAILVPLELMNRGGDGPGVTVNIRNPTGSAFRRATAAMGSTPVPVDCREGTEGGTVRCHVGHPVFRADST
ncbi:integrin alpha-L-like, partial [Excalfactoria chinensis]|uniref:integrin alpha-L-like n=1 Tax=Excalfactoria chinensis TaxID=46218 RepID=UPI003B3B5B90